MLFQAKLNFVLKKCFYEFFFQNGSYIPDTSLTSHNSFQDIEVVKIREYKLISIKSASFLLYTGLLEVQCN